MQRTFHSFIFALIIMLTCTFIACSDDEDEATNQDPGDDVGVMDTGDEPDAQPGDDTDEAPDAADEQDDDTALGEDTGDEHDAGDDNDVGEEPDADPGEEGIEVVFRFVDFLTTAPLEGATFTLGDVSETTDDEGEVTLFIEPDEPFFAELSGSGMRDHHFYNRITQPDDALYTTIIYSIATDGAISAVEFGMGMSVDDSKGIISISIGDKETGENIPDVTVDADVDYEAALAFDSDATGGLSEGNTTLEGSQSAIILVNTETGDLTPSFEHDDGITCDIGQSPVPIEAGTFVLASYGCE